MNNVKNFDDLKNLKAIPLDTVFEFDGEEWKNIPYDYYADRYLVSDSGKSWEHQATQTDEQSPERQGIFWNQSLQRWSIQTKEHEPNSCPCLY